MVLMGETGCGKTHLIRFMCKFAAMGAVKRHEMEDLVNEGELEDHEIEQDYQCEDTMRSVVSLHKDDEHNLQNLFMLKVRE